MARPAGLKLWPWLGLALLLHGAALEWLARESETRVALQPLGPAMYTRMLQPAAVPPQAVVPVAVGGAEVPQGVIAVAPAPARAAASAAGRGDGSGEASQSSDAASRDSSPDVVAANESVVADPVVAEESQTSAPMAEPASSEVASSDALPSGASPSGAAPSGSTPPGASPSEVAPPEAPPPLAASSAPAGTESRPTTAAAATERTPRPEAVVSPDPWPPDTRLNYRLGGQFRSGPLHGEARVLWQREGTRYQVQVDLDVTLWARMIITSQGEVTPAGLQPQAYEEVRPGRKRRGAAFGREQVVLDNGSNAPRPPGMQDAASQFLELAHRFATGRETLAPGRTVDLWLGRPGGVDLWTYDVVALETLDTPGFGPVQAWRLKPRPVSKPRGKVAAEMWFAPSLQYLPVRIRLWTGDDAVIELVATAIEQR